MPLDPLDEARTIARELHGCGYTVAAIVRHLDHIGQPVTRFAVARWVDPKRAERHRDASRRRQARLRVARRERESLRTGRPLDEKGRLERIRVLREEGMSYASLSVLIRVDWNLHLTPDDIRGLLRARRPRSETVARLGRPS